MKNPDGGFLHLRTAALIAVLVGAAGSVGFVLRSGQNTPRLPLVIMSYRGGAHGGVK